MVESVSVPPAKVGGRYNYFYHKRIHSVQYCVEILAVRSSMTGARRPPNAETVTLSPMIWCGREHGEAIVGAKMERNFLRHKLH